MKKVSMDHVYMSVILTLVKGAIPVVGKSRDDIKTLWAAINV